MPRSADAGAARVLIAGAGYVGSELAVRLAASGHDVFTLRRSRAEIAGVTPLNADLLDPSTLRDLPDALDAVVYAAAPDGSEPAYRAVYVDGLKNLITALSASALPTTRLLLTTSTAVYAQDAGEEIDEDSPAGPVRYQGRTLLEAETIAERSGMRAIGIRFGGIYGPGRTRLLEEVRSGAAAVPDRPSYTNRIHRDDCAGVLAHLMNVPDPAPIYLGVDDEPADRRVVVEWLAERLAAPKPRVETNDGPHGKRCRNRRLRSSGYRFEFPTFREGYADVIAKLR